MATKNNPPANDDQENEFDFEGVGKELNAFLKDLGKAANKSKAVMDLLPSLNTLEKRQVKIGGMTCAISLLDKGGILIEFPNGDVEAAKQHYNTQYPPAT